MEDSKVLGQPRDRADHPRFAVAQAGRHNHNRHIQRPETTVAVSGERGAAATQHAAPSGLRLTRENLRRHNLDFPQGGHVHYVEDLVSMERIQKHNIARYHQLRRPDGSTPEDGAEGIAAGMETRILPEVGLEEYRVPRSSDVLPVERFLTMSPLEDPHPWLARQEMRAMGIDCGGMETVRQRVDAVEAITSRKDTDRAPLPGSLLSSSPTLQSPMEHRGRMMRSARAQDRMRRPAV